MDFPAMFDDRNVLSLTDGRWHGYGEPAQEERGCLLTLLEEKLQA